MDQGGERVVWETDSKSRSKSGYPSGDLDAKAQTFKVDRHLSAGRLVSGSLCFATWTKYFNRTLYSGHAGNRVARYNKR
jgi:hypothetical protein